MQLARDWDLVCSVLNAVNATRVEPTSYPRGLKQLRLVGRIGADQQEMGFLPCLCRVMVPQFTACRAYVECGPWSRLVRDGTGETAIL